jgi:ketosteroid isomerase-like protein
MSNVISRAVVEGFYKALGARDMKTLAKYLDDDVVWTISGPVDILPFCGQRRGKSVVLNLLVRDIPTLLTGRRFTPNAMLVDGDRAAVLGKLTAVKRDGGRSISYRIAQFMRFEAEKVVEYTSIIDSFDAVEQMLGHPIAVQDGRQADTGTLIAV